MDRHPGRMFIERYGLVQSRDDVLRYANFLRREAGIGDEPPVNLAPIFEHFGMPPPRCVALPGQQAILLDEIGLVLVNEDDPEARQRFSQAHELIERLFAAHYDALNQGRSGAHFREPYKESLCDQAAAHLLLPLSSFLPRVDVVGVGLEAASQLATEYQTSWLATLFRMVRHGPGAHVLVVWQHTLKPVQERNLPSAEQLPLLPVELIPMPEKEMRVWWSTGNHARPELFVPPHKSVPRDSLIFRAFDTGVCQNGEEFVNLGRIKGTCGVEAKRVTIGDKKAVISLLHLRR
jgi:hypothetical protein